MADGRDLRKSNGPMEVSVPGGGSPRRYGGLPVQRQTRYSGSAKVSGTRPWLTRLADKITIDKSGANTAAIESVIADTGAPVQLRQSKYLNNIVEQDHRFIKRIIRPMLGFKSFRCARIVLAGIETMHQIRKGQLRNPRGQTPSAAEQFYSLAF